MNLFFDTSSLFSVLDVKGNLDYFVCPDKTLNRIYSLEGIEVI